MLGYRRALEARRPATSPTRLRELATDDVRPVRVLVARNFDTPRDALEQLTRDEDDDVRTSAIYTLNFPEMAVRWRANGGQIAPPAQELSGFLHEQVAVRRRWSFGNLRNDEEQHPTFPLQLV
ncbi:hypothetical protein Daura_31825 [Dactylosporangium aurantiacum]|uniref:HEAT repeat domain-containing protein n=1 Tax=Dactylosporangium aurantiacum TaxID=35754 RepID=A0A9Q9IDS2_9ACTN|nr:hypothetical protein [Dactylosporangium aurantiacum]MDG6110077.1 hypothetical protein [Dactylosporangium aurantiacum]UWZ51328.1 hypothetical protein Daura_31825 [Dactylosporangium aurantiacum]